MLTFLAPQFLWALAAIPVVVLLHFIRVRTRRLDVAGLFLWRQATELAQARRRFSPTWLLLLQILFVTLAALALAQPTLKLTGAPDRVFVIDASASMTAHDSDGVRLDKAVTEAEALLRDTARALVVRAGLDASVVQPLTDDHAQVRRALDSIEAGDAQAELRRALELAASVAPDAELHLFSDAGVPRGLEATFHDVGGDAANIGISAFELRHQQAFVSLVSSTPRPQEVNLEVFRGEELAGRTTVLIPADGQANATFPIGRAAGTYRAVIDVPDWDGLEIDNVAYAANRNLQVHVTPSAPHVERALAAIPGLDYRVTPSLPGAASFDALVMTGDPPSDPEPGRYLVLAPPAEDARVERIVDWDRADRLMQFVDLTETRVAVAADLDDTIEGDWKVLARTGDLTPVILRKTTTDVDMVLFRFHPSQTDMVNRSAFPFLIANIMEAFRAEDKLTMGSRLPTAEEILINGEPARLERAVVPGLYRVGDNAFTVSLLSAEQSRLPEAPPAPEPGAREVERLLGERDQAIGLWLVAVALVVLVGEWVLWARSRAGLSRARA